jgi:hypothetical protein
MIADFVYKLPPRLFIFSAIAAGSILGIVIVVLIIFCIILSRSSAESRGDAATNSKYFNLLIPEGPASEVAKIQMAHQLFE